MRNIFVISALLFCLSVFSQEDRTHIRKGNKLYEKENYVEAEQSYLRALEINNQSTKAEYNLGNALYKQNKFALP